MSNWAEEVCRPILAHQKNEQLKETWGHLAPKKNVSYKGKIWFAVSAFQSGSLLLIDYEFENLESSPWLYDAVQKHINEFDVSESKVYCVVTVFKNYKFKSKLVELLSVGGCC